MAQAGDEWELSKENVQPLRQGRDMSTLQEVLCQQENTYSNAIQQKKQSFELELRFYSGDDPLDVWDRYIKWAEQAFPQGGKESNLSPLLERAVKMFHQEKKYYGDLRYLNICLKFANFCTEPIDLYSYIHSQGIGILHSQLYITWAEEYEARGNYKKADSIFQEGINCKAEPLEKLEVHHKQFQSRVSRQVLQGITEEAVIEDSVSEPQRTSLVDLKSRGKNKARAPVSRVGDSIKTRSLMTSAPNAVQPQISSTSRFQVLDENAGSVLTNVPIQPWPALPPARAKENEQKAGTWNSRRPPRSDQNSSSDPPQSFPSFTPYVDDLSEQQTVTPCKINPSVTSVLSSLKNKEDDPLHRLQSNSHGKEEMVMYCKNKVYAGVEEFSLEEIRAEIYMAKIRKKREEDLQASANRRQEMERQIEEMEKKLKVSCATNKDEDTAGATCTKESIVVHCDSETKHKVAHENSQVGQCLGLPGSALTLPSSDDLTNAENSVDSKGLLSLHSSEVPFTIFDEESTCNTASENIMLPPNDHPLATVLKNEVPLRHVPLKDTIYVTEPLNEEAIVSGADGNKTLFADPEDTCDFMRAAQLASTPFSKTKEEAVQSETPSLKRLPLREKTPVNEESCRQDDFPRKLSPILEASQEDTHSSVSSVHSMSAGSSSLSASKTLLVHEKLDITAQLSGVCEQSLEVSVIVKKRELCQNLLESMPELLTSKEIHHEAGQISLVKDQETIQFGGEIYHLKSEFVLGENSKLYMGFEAGCNLENSKGIGLKVDSHAVPWDLYITQQLKERLGDAFEANCVKQSNCYLFKDGCVTLFKDISQFTVQDILTDAFVADEQVLILLAFNFLSLVEKLHTIGIVHGDLRPQTLILDNRIFNLSSCTKINSCLKLIDFSHSMDMRLCPTLTARAFPIMQTEYGQQVLGTRNSPYQVDLLGIANVMHLIIFRENLNVLEEESMWKICKEIPRLWNGNLWNKFFSKTLNTTDHESTACVLKELKEEISYLTAGSI